ncbi:MAG: cytochrome c [Acidobacteriia bacterium]|nr:cytochrome c [Terriglobia bacterium]
MRRQLTYTIVCFLMALPAATAKDVTFYKDVLPVLQKRCIECHRAGEAAPMPLVTYKDVRPWAKAIREAVKIRRMPPWHADPHYGSFSNDRSLSNEEIETLAQWADTGATEGSSKDAPPPVQFAEGWTIGKPDAIIPMPEPFPVPAKGTVEYTYFIVPTGFTEDKWIDKIEVRPGSRAVVHHIVVMARPPGSPYLKSIPIGKPYVPDSKSRAANRPPAGNKGVLEGAETGFVEVVTVYVPGGVAYQTRPGQARLIKAGSHLIFQMHYTANGTAATDLSRVGIVFAKEPPKERVFNTFLTNRSLRIPPGASSHRVDAMTVLHEDVQVQALFPHMHLRGQAFQYVAKLPSGESMTLLRVPKYDFNWQLTYFLDQPVNLPKGTELTATAWFDNSPNNKYNPDPAAEVFWGDQSWEEMIAGFIDFVIPAGLDPAYIAKPRKVQTSSVVAPLD